MPSKGYKAADSPGVSAESLVELEEMKFGKDFDEEDFASASHNSSSSFSTSKSSSEKLQEQILNVGKTTRRTRVAAIMVVVVGAVAASAFLYMGISNSHDDVDENFERRASDFAKEIDSAWNDYEAAARWAHSECRNWRTDNFTHDDFEAVYHYLVDGGLDFFSIDWIPNITQDERAYVEATEGPYWKNNIPGAENYAGFTGQEDDPDKPGELIYANRTEQPFYFPVYFVEPKSAASSIIHYDLYSAPWEGPVIQRALDTYEPALTARFILAQHTDEDGYSTILYHPGVELPQHLDEPDPRRDLSLIIMNINSFLQRAARFQNEPMAVYLYDKTLYEMDDGVSPPEFLGGVQVDVDSEETREVTLFKEVEYAGLQDRKLYYERLIKVGGRTWTTVVVAVDGSYEEDLTFVLLCGIMIFVASILLAAWMIHNMRQSIKLHNVISNAAAEAAIVSNLFPANIRDRMVQDAQDRGARSSKAEKDVFKNLKGGKLVLSETRLNQMMSSDGIFGGKAVAELHPYTTVMVADLVGFTAWASVREPSQVFTLLELIFYTWDSIAALRRVFKVETVGDAYVAVSGLPDPRDDHAVVMARFANDCLNRLHALVKALEKTLGPGTGSLGCRIGLHSGQVVGGVIRGDKGRFQLFGDTVNMAARMESTGVPNKIQVSQETADLLKKSGHAKWLLPRSNEVYIKGRGNLPTYMVQIRCGSKGESTVASTAIDDLSVSSGSSPKTDSLIAWNVQVLSDLLRKIVARREGMRKHSGKVRTGGGLYSAPLSEVVDVIKLPEYQACAVKAPVNPDAIELDEMVVDQLQSLVSRIAASYRSNPFHNFAHASHVNMSVLKMLGRIVAPKVITKGDSKSLGEKEMESALHDHTFGITSDPLIHFACSFAALLHDADHQGVPNMVLVEEESPLAAKYDNKSVAEQNSVDLVWGFLMSSEYAQLRACICCDQEEFERFRSLVVNSVMATDIMDKQLGAARKARWNIAFSKDDNLDLSQREDKVIETSRKATIVIEHLIQASDISHTMQHWHVYSKWNENLFQEMYKAYKEGRMEKDPSVGWYHGEIGFFDFYIIPLAKKLFTCGVFGVSSDEFLNYANINRKEWEQKGEAMVQQYLKNYKEKYENGASEDLMSC